MSPAPGSPGAPLWDPDAIPAATVVVLRDGPAGVEVLMLKRDRDLSFAGGMWVFPGGRIDPADRSPEDPEADVEPSARRAAVRETFEEAGLAVEADALRRWSHWTPPPRADKRFSTAFFIAPVSDATVAVTIDDGEIRDHRWGRPVDVIALRDAGEIALAPPTYITLSQLGRHHTVGDVLALAEGREIEHFATRVATIGDSWIALYHGDVAYEGGDPEAAGPRHRLWMGDPWRYERDV